MRSSDYSELGYEHLLVYFVYRYLMNSIYDYDILFSPGSFQRLVTRDK